MGSMHKERMGETEYSESERQHDNEHHQQSGTDRGETHNPPMDEQLKEV